MSILDPIETYFKVNDSCLKEAIFNSKFEKTAQVLYNFYDKSLSISEVINSIDYNKNIYPCIILLRCQIEHFIVSSYIWISFRINKSDKIASIYYGEYLIQELLKRLNYAKKNNINSESRYAFFFQKILDVLTYKKIITQKDIEKINSEANQFDIRNISKFFDRKLPLELDNIIRPERIKQFLEYYNYFSSFVHGGPSADMIIKEKKNNPFIDAMTNSIEWSDNIVNFQRILLLYFLAMENNKFEKDFELLIETMFK